MLLKKFPPMERLAGAQCEVLSAVAERYRWAGRVEKGRSLTLIAISIVRSASAASIR
jgi:hypothetical protein